MLRNKGKNNRHSRMFLAGIYAKHPSDKMDARLKFRLLNPATNGILKAGHSGMTSLLYAYACSALGCVTAVRNISK